MSLLAEAAIYIIVTNFLEVFIAEVLLGYNTESEKEVRDGKWEMYTKFKNPKNQEKIK